MALLTHLPILQIFVPLVSAPVCLVLRKSGLVWLFSLISSTLVFLISATLLQQVLQNGTISYTLGGWLTALGLEYRIDTLSAYVLLIISALSTLTLIAAFPGIRTELPEQKHTSFYVAFLLCLAGLSGVAASGDLINMFVFVEITAFATYVMISLGTDRRALLASYQYFIAGTIGAVLLLSSIGLIYLAAGTLNITLLAQQMPGLAGTGIITSALCLFVVGIALKLALFPLHLWLPAVYRYAPAVVTMFIAAASIPVSAYVLIRLIYTVFGIDFQLFALPLQNILLFVSLAGILIASITAIYQKNLVYLLAYATIAQIGFIVLGLGIGNQTGLMAASLYLFNHAIIIGLLFLLVCALKYRNGVTDISSLQGLGSRMPWTMAAFVTGGLSLVGMPITAGFISKWHLVLAAIEQGWWVIAILILVASLLTFIYIWRIIESAWLKPAMASDSNTSELPLTFLIPIWILMLSNIWFGIDTRLTVGISQLVAQGLFGLIP